MLLLPLSPRSMPPRVSWMRAMLPVSVGKHLALPLGPTLVVAPCLALLLGVPVELFPAPVCDKGGTGSLARNRREPLPPKEG